jgi:hypothetical protein
MKVNPTDKRSSQGEESTPLAVTPPAYAAAVPWIHSAAGIAVAILVWVLVWFLSFAGLTLLDRLRGTDHGWLQPAFRELIAPAIGGYAAMLASHRLFLRAHMSVVFWGLTIPVFTFMIGGPLYFIIFGLAGFTFSWKEQVLRWIGGALAIVAARIGLNTIKTGSAPWD